MSEDPQVALRKFLLSKQEITNCVRQRIYCDMAPEKAAMPFIVMTVIHTRHDHTLSDLAGLAHTRIQFDCTASTRSTSVMLANEIRKSGICRHKGDMHGLDVRGARLEDGARHIFEPPIDGSEEPRYTVNFDLMLDHIEEV